jgi:hypothetical protein
MNHHKNKHNRDSNDKHCENNPDPKDIEHRAYELFLERGGGTGRDFEDWLRAERELKERGQAAMSDR